MKLRLVVGLFLKFRTDSYGAFSLCVYFLCRKRYSMRCGSRRIVNLGRRFDVHWCGLQFSASLS